MAKDRPYQSLSAGELSKKLEELYESIHSRRDQMLKLIDEVEEFNAQINLIEEEWNAREQ